MKKLSLLLICVLAFVSCDVEDDGPNIAFHLSEVTETNLPEYFGEGELFEVDVTYLLPSACHLPAGLEVSRGGNTGDKRRDIYIYGVSSFESDMTECDEEGEEEDLSAEGSFNLRIDEDEPYTFYLWTGVDEDDENQYTIIEVPVGAPDPADEE